MDKNLSRIDFLLKHIDLVINDVKGKTLEEFASSSLQVRATAFSLVQIGEQMSKLEKEFGTVYPEMPWFEAIRFRNLIVHVYHIVDADQIYKTAIEEMEGLKNHVLTLNSNYLKV